MPAIGNRSDFQSFEGGTLILDVKFQPTVLSELEQIPEFEKLWHVTLELNSSWLKDNIYSLQLTKAQIQPVITKSVGLAAECFRSRFELLSKVSLDAPDYYVTRQPCLTLVKDWDDVLYNSDNFQEIVRSVFTDQFLGTIGDDANFFGWDNALAKIVEGALAQGKKPPFTGLPITDVMQKNIAKLDQHAAGKDLSEGALRSIRGLLIRRTFIEGLYEDQDVINLISIFENNIKIMPEAVHEFIRIYINASKLEGGLMIANAILIDDAYRNQYASFKTVGLTPLTAPIFEPKVKNILTLASPSLQTLSLWESVLRNGQSFIDSEESFASQVNKEHPFHDAFSSIINVAITERWEEKEFNAIALYAELGKNHLSCEKFRNQSANQRLTCIG